LAGCQAFLLLKNPIKVGWVIEARLVAGIEDMAGLIQTLTSKINPFAAEKPIEGLPGDFFKQLRVATGGELAEAGHFLDLQGLLQVGQ
jgi:hypothetical protein